MSLGKIRIETGDNVPAMNWHIYLNDTDISHFVRTITIDVEAGGIPMVHLGLIGELDLPQELQATVVAEVLPGECYGDMVDATSIADDHRVYRKLQ